MRPGGRQRVTWLLLAGVGVLGLSCACLFARYVLTSGESESLTTDTDSAQLKTSAERVAFLGRYLKLRAPVKDAAFQIVYHDNSGGLPGPSDWWIAAVVLGSAADGPAWLSGARPLAASHHVDPRWPRTGHLIPAAWQVSSPGVSYIRDGARLVWHSEGVLEFAATTH